MPQIRLIVTGGEPLWGEVIQRAENVLGSGHLLFRSTFQASQAGTIGYQCDRLNINEYHIHEELQFVEIDPDTRELITTNLDRVYMPVVRMKTGDLAEFIHADCGCGRSTRMLRLLGRKTDLVKIGGKLFDPSLFDRVAEKFKFARDKWQVRLRP
jgi:phenylacetate-coenzyme A ligase PaaK-like adenylate-forming protein